MSAPVFEIEDLHAVTADTGIDLLNRVDLRINEGELHVLMGPSGSGTSTLASVLLGSPAYRVTEGAVRLRGEDITTWDPDFRARAGVRNPRPGLLSGRTI